MDNTAYPFSLPREERFAEAASLSGFMTLRNACAAYRDAHGIAWDGVSPAEMSRAASQGQISCMNKFTNVVGIPIDSAAILFNVEEIDNVDGMLEYTSDLLHDSISEGVIWCVRQTRSYKRKGKFWYVGDSLLPRAHADILQRVSSCKFNAVSAYTAHAAVEASKFGSEVRYDDIFTFPHNATPSVGLIGSLGDNQAIDMAPYEEGVVPDMDAREWKDEYLGVVCAFHTSHSTEAGRMRKVACDVNVRILSEQTLDCINSLRLALGNQSIVTGNWLLFFMGKYTFVSSTVVKAVCMHHAALSIAGGCAYSLYIDSSSRTVVMLCSSGTLVKLTSSGFRSDSSEIHRSHRPFGYKQSVIDVSGKDSKRACFSAYALLAEYLEFDRAPRPSIASVQLPQAVCLPWAVGTAAVSPCYTFQPLTTTPLYKAVMKDQKEGNANLATYMPGENVGVLYLNLQENYEDAILVSQRYIDNGGFLSISMCTYLLSPSEYVPPVGHKLCSIVCPWWKPACHPNCKHTKEWMSKRNVVAGTRYTSGTVYEVSRTNQGEWSVKVKSFEQLQQGDKLSTKHGQKGVAITGVLNPEDMPVVVDKRGVEMIPDVVVAMSSIVTRQTNGQLYETAHALSLLKDCNALPAVCEPGEAFDKFESCTVLRGTNRKPFTTLTTLSNGSQHEAPTLATFGYVRMFSQTQKSRERHQVSHLSLGPGTLRTTTGRSRGGAVAFSEMDIQASVAAGLKSCCAEIVSRGSMVVAPVCTSCQRLWLLCKRTDDCTQHIPTRIPFDQVVHTITVKIVYDIDILYDVEMDM